MVFWSDSPAGFLVAFGASVSAARGFSRRFENALSPAKCVFSADSGGARFTATGIALTLRRQGCRYPAPISGQYSYASALTEVSTAVPLKN